MSGSENSPVAEVTPGLGSLNYAEPIVDSDEDEIFFGPVKSEKEQRGRNSRVDSRRETLKLNEPVIKVSSKEARRKSNLNGLILEEGDESEDKENLPDAKVANCFTNRVVEKYSHFQSPLSKFPALMERLGLDPETDDSSSSIVDVDNDQMFDNSIFTEYDDKDLSIMSQKISKKFRSGLKHEQKAKKCPKVPKTPPTVTTNTDLGNTSSEQQLETNIEKVKRNLDFESVGPLKQDNEAPMSENDGVFLMGAKGERSLNGAPPNDDSILARTSSQGSATSDWFNTTREEMILYEKYGEDYDLIVEKMSTDEKKLLKKDIANSIPKDIEELLNSQTEVYPNFIDNQNGEITESPFQFGSDHDAEKRTDIDDSHSSESETSPLNPTFEEAVHPATSPGSSQFVVKESNDGFKSPKVPVRAKNCAVRGAEFVTPPNFSKKRYFKSPKSLNSPSYLRPTTSSQQKTSPKNTRSPSPSPARSNHIGTPVLTPFGQANKRRPFDMAKIVSPVAQYIHTSNVPKLLRNIKPRATRFMEDAILAIQESDEIEVAEERDTNRQKKRFFKPLPEAEYRSSRVAFEKNLPCESHKDLHKKFMTANSTEAVVVRHVGRERVPQKEMESWSSSPGNKENPESGGIIKKTRESEIFDETSVEMSIHEVRKINKLMPSVSRKHLY